MDVVSCLHFVSLMWAYVSGDICVVHWLLISKAVFFCSCMCLMLL
ncbi:unnamed protein product [Brassica oleracea]